MPIIEVKDLRKTYTSYKKQAGLKAAWKNIFHREKIISEAVKGVSFSVEQGELVGFLGPNGAGKTTSLKMLSGIIAPTSGETHVLGHDPYKREKEFQKRFAIVMGQKNQLWWDLPAIDSFALHREIYETPEKQYRETLDELTEILGVQAVLEKPVRNLSLGERMKCELINALLHAPEVLFLDEPTIGLDVVAQKNIRDFIKRYNRERHTTILLTSHYMDDIKDLCERVIVIDKGQVAFDGLLSDMIKKHAPYKYLKVVFASEVRKTDVRKYGTIKNLEGCRVVFEVKRNKIREVATNLLNSDLAVEDLTIEETDIDSVIRTMFETSAE